SCNRRRKPSDGRLPPARLPSPQTRRLPVMRFREQPCSRRRTAVRVEALEDRCVPACQVTVSGNTLTIIGDDGPNVISLVDNGGAGPGNVVGVCDGTATPLPASAISTLEVRTGRGDDRVDYRLDAKLAAGTARAMLADLGDGKDTLVMRLNG